jgi:uridine phosphorylase
MEEGKQYHIGLGPGDVGRYVLLPGDPGRVPLIASFFDNAEKIASNREYTTYTGTVGGIKISATSTGIGCPSTAIAVEELAKVGADTFIRVGTAGSLQRSIGLGDLVISSGSVREEGTTRQYVPLSYPAVSDLDVTLALRNAAGSLGFRSHVGITHTKDAFYIEDYENLPLAEYHRERWKVWERARVQATAMEASALFVISSIKGLRAGEILAVIGLTYDDAPIVKKAGIEDAIRTAIEAIKLLHAWDTSKWGRARGSV